jgi:hypothetical protein
MRTIDQQGDVHTATGHYAARTHSEPEVRLESNDEGTFLFPPAVYENSAAYLRFWANVPISDGVLANVSAGYADSIRRQTNLLGVDWGHIYDREHEVQLHQGSTTSREAAREQRNVAHSAMLAEFYETHPPRIKAGFARTVARAGQIYFYQASLDKADVAEVLASTVQLGSETLTVLDVQGRYKLSDIRDYFQDPEISAAERLEDLRIELRTAAGK